MAKVSVLKLSRNLLGGEYRELLQMVSTEKQARIARFIHVEDAWRTLLGELIVRREIRKRLAILNRDIFFSRNEYGKPFLLGHPDFHFNVSHSGSYIVCAFDSEETGIDIEEVKEVDLGVAQRFFHKEEAAYIESRREDMKHAELLRIWTMKEAYIKRDGRGINISLESFSVFSLPGVYFHQLINGAGAVCSLCSSKKAPPPVSTITLEDLILTYAGPQ
jgi:4'-phosphopantetheinyl transferase